MLESRYEQDGQRVYEIDGVTYLWRGERVWEIKDGAGLLAELERVTKDRPLLAIKLRHAWKRVTEVKFDNTFLNELADLDEDCRDVITDFRRRRERPRHLSKLDGEKDSGTG